MGNAPLGRTTLLYRLYVIFNEPLLWGPILTISFQKLAHMSIPEIYFMEGCVLGLCMVLDIPLGALADIIGRKKTIIIGRILLFVSVVLFTTMQNPLDAWLGNILWAVGFTMQSGADTALLYDTLKAHGKENEFKRIEGRAVGGRLFLLAFCSLGTGALAEIDLRLPLWIGLPFTLIPLAAAFFFEEIRHTEKYSATKQLAVLKNGVLLVLRSRELRWIVGFAGLLATISKVWFFAYNPYFVVVNLPLSHYGFIFFFLNIVAWFTSHFAEKIEHWLGERRCVITMVLCLGIPIILMALVPIAACSYLVIVQNVVRGFMRPFIGDYMNTRSESNARATILSVQSSITNLAAMAGLLLFGFATQYLSLLNTLLALGAMSLTLGLASYRSYTKMVCER